MFILERLPLRTIINRGLKGCAPNKSSTWSKIGLISPKRRPTYDQNIDQTICKDVYNVILHTALEICIYQTLSQKMHATPGPTSVHAPILDLQRNTTGKLEIHDATNFGFDSVRGFCYICSRIVNLKIDRGTKRFLTLGSDVWFPYWRPFWHPE